MAGGFLAGIGGAQLSTAYTHTWVENMTQGKGIVAVALVIFAAWKPAKALLGAYLFGGAQALQLVIQQQGYDISPLPLFMTPSPCPTARRAWSICTPITNASAIGLATSWPRGPGPAA